MQNSQPSSSKHNTGSHLRRGQACFHCRRRKIRCDGAHPICGPCRRDNRPDDCEYTHGQHRARAEMLEENISQIEARITELQQPRKRSPENPSRVLLKGPYVPGASTHDNWATAAEPPMDMVENLVDTFLLSASEFGFFLNHSRFRQSATQRQLFGSHHRPLPALLTVVYLWGLRLSKQHMFQSQEPLFLVRALKLTTNGLSAPHPDRVLHTLQAEILLTYYLFASGRFLEGKYRASAAASLALSTGINAIRSATNLTPGVLAPARDAVEEGERIHAWWAVVVLDNTWAVALEESPHLHLARDADTPWPLEMEQYEKGFFDASKRYSNTISKFIHGSPTSDMGTSTYALLAKAAILWQRAYALRISSTRYDSAPVKALDALIARFITSLPLPGNFPHLTPAMARTLLVAHSIAHAAAIELHREREANSESGSRKARLASARALLGIVVATASTPLPGGAINPVMGVRFWSHDC
ncbi:hypothetical protein C8F01DRAFT_973624 [Mycena amicta]|nr:hypothetical protein C8F01DRAFT_973624 [Mycena amicta]